MSYMAIFLAVILFQATATSGAETSGVIAARLQDGREAISNSIPPVITNMVELALVVAKPVPQRLRVRLRGVVIPTGNRYIGLIDGDMGAIGVDMSPRSGRYPRGEILDIEGYVDTQSKSDVMIEKVTRVGPGIIPPPRQVGFDDIRSGAFEGQRATIAGVVRQIRSRFSAQEVTLFTGGKRLYVRMLPKAAQRVSIGDEISVTGFCYSKCHIVQHALHPVMLVMAADDVVVTRKMPDPFSLPTLSFDRPNLFCRDPVNRYGVRIRGTVTYGVQGNAFWIRDGLAGINVRSSSLEKLEPGDVVDVFGFIASVGYSLAIEDAMFRKTGRVPPPGPVKIDSIPDAVQHDADLVQIEGRLSEGLVVQGGVQWMVDNGSNSFLVVLAQTAPGPLPGEWRAGSQIRVTGVCRVDPPEFFSRHEGEQSIKMNILMRGPQDLTVLKPAPWWTPGRVAQALVLMVGLLSLLIMAFVVVVRLKLRRQANERKQAEAEFAAVLSERNRIAREIHDTLAQGLSAISVNLELARHRLPEDSAALKPLERAQGLARTNLADARSTIWSMSSQALETGDLASALEGIIKSVPFDCRAKIELCVLGVRRRLSPVVENNVLRIGQEAVANAAKHADAARIEVVLEYGAALLRLKVADDGKGYDPATPRAGGGGFGLGGMRERAEAISGTLVIWSEPGKGTLVTFEVPI